MCSHDGCCYNAKVVDYYVHLQGPNRFVSFLPMNHIAAQFVDVMIPVFYPVTVFIARPDALRGTLLATLTTAKPTLFVAVPRVWEKFAEKLKDTFAASSVRPLISSHT